MTLHPTAKILLFGGLLAPAIIFQHPVLLLLAGVIYAWLAYRFGLSRTGWKMALAVGSFTGLFTAVTWMPFVPEGSALLSWTVPGVGWQILLTDTGILFGIGMGLRFFTITVLSLGYVLTTSPRQMAMGIRGLGLPFPVAHLFALTFRLMPMAQNDLLTIREAQMVRGLDLEHGSTFAKMRRYSALLGPLIISSLRRVQLIANALDVKGFQLRGGQHRFFRAPLWTGRDRAAAAAGILVVVGTIGLRWLGFLTLIPGRL